MVIAYIIRGFHKYITKPPTRDQRLFVSTHGHTHTYIVKQFIVIMVENCHKSGSLEVKN